MAGDEGEKLKRERAGTYRSADGRFTVEQSSSGWLLLDEEQVNELGLPLARGPFATLDEARDALSAARSGAPEAPTPIRRPKRPVTRSTARSEATADVAAAESRAAPRPGARSGARTPARIPRRERPSIVIRELRAVDGEQLRKLWAECGFRSLGDDDLGLARMARRNPGLLVVAAEGSRVVGSALGAWDGRRGWIYHVATAATHRRQGIARRLVAKVEAGLRDLGCPKVSVLVRDDNEHGRDFWMELGYETGARQYARELAND